MEDEIVLKRRLDATDEPKDLPLALLQKITNGFSEERKIGQGGFGAVYKGELGSVIVAVKRIYVNLDKLGIDDKLFDREFNSLWTITHENVVRFLGFCSNTYQTPIKDDASGKIILANVGERLFCLEFISGGSLDKHITDELRGLEWETRYEIITGICKGLCYLHKEKNIIHMYLKPENILLNDILVPKITDFGLSRPNKNSHTMDQPIGTRGYISPEYMEDGKTTPACDIYSLGLIIIEIITGYKEVPDKHNVLRRWRHRWNNPPTPLQYQQVTGCIDIAVRCRKQDPKARPSIKEIIELLSESTDGHTGQEISTYMDDDMLGIEPLELHFTSELNKEMSWTVKLTNKTKTCFAFYIERPSQQYTIRPDKGIVPPEYNEYLIQITLQPQDRAPQVTQNADMFVVHSRTVSNGYRVEDITEHIFHEGAGKVVDEVYLMVVYEPTKLGSSGKAEVASPDINSSAPGQYFVQTEQVNLQPLQSFSCHYPTNKKHLGNESDQAVDVARGAMGSLLDKLGKLVIEDYNLEKSVKRDIDSFSENLMIMHPEDHQPSSSRSSIDSTMATKLQNAKGLSVQHIEEITNTFSPKRIIGIGGFGTVYKGVYPDGSKVAVKVLHKNTIGIDDGLFIREFQNLMRLEHRNIVRLVAYCHETQHKPMLLEGETIFYEDTCRALCLEYMPNGSLTNHISDESDGLGWPIRYKIIKGTCEGLKYLHEGFREPIYHMDLKPDNILLDENYVPKLADFGMSKLYGDEQTRFTSNCVGTWGYMPPEYIYQQVVSKKLDIFSLGVVMTKIIAGPRGNSRSVEMPSQNFIDEVNENWRNRLQETVHNSQQLQAYCQQVNVCIAIGLSCMDMDWHKRPNIVDIIHKLNGTESVIEEFERGQQWLR